MEMKMEICYNHYSTDGNARSRLHWPA